PQRVGQRTAMSPPRLDEGGLEVLEQSRVAEDGPVVALLCADPNRMDVRRATGPAPNPIEGIEVEGDQPRFGDPPVSNAVEPDRAPLRVSPADAPPPVGELDGGVLIRERLADLDPQRVLCERAPLLEVAVHRATAAMVAGDRARAGDVPHDLVGEEGGYGLDRAAGVHLPLPAPELREQLLVLAGAHAGAPVRARHSRSI